MASHPDMEEEMGFWTNVSVGKRAGRKVRTKIGLVRYADAGPGLMILPPSMDVSLGDLIKYYVTEDGFAFRIEDDPDGYKVRVRSPTSRSLAVTLPEELARDLPPKTTDVDFLPVDGGWRVVLPS